MALAPELSELRDSLRDVAKGLVARQQGNSIKIVAFVEPRDKAAIERSVDVWIAFQQSHSGLRTVLDTEYLEEGAIESFIDLGFEELV